MNFASDISCALSLLLMFLALYLTLRPPQPIITVTDLTFYPVKSCAGIHLKSALVDEAGIRFDRYWAIVDSNHILVSLKMDPQLLRLEPEILLNEAGNVQTLILKHGVQEFRLQFKEELEGDAFQVVIFRQPRMVKSEGPEAAAFLRSALHKDYILVRATNFCPPHPEFLTPKDTVINLAAALHFHITSEDSMADLQTQLPTRKQNLPIEVFRGNITVKGAPPYAEDTWGDIEINGVKITCIKSCRMCPIPTIDQETLEYDQGQEPNTTLKQVHGLNQLPMFGEWGIRKNNGIINVGDRVKILSRKKFTS